MSDALAAIIIDVTGASAASSVYVEDDAPSTQAGEWGELIAACTPSEVEAVTRMTGFFITADPGWDGYPVGVCAVLHFLADDAPYDVLIPSPSYPCFLEGGAVDESYGPIADVIAWVLANGRNPANAPIDSYVSGERTTIAPGVAACYGAAAVIGSGTALEGNFHAVPDGTDVKAGE